MEEGKNMSKLSAYIKDNKDFVYSFASKNTPKNQNDTIVVPENDEWRNEPEWEKIFNGVEGNLQA